MKINYSSSKRIDIIKSMTNKKFYILIFLIIQIILITSLLFEKKQNENLYYKTLRPRLEREFNVSVGKFELLANSIFNDIIDDPFITEKFYQASITEPELRSELRREIYEYINPQYSWISEGSFRDIHFHFTDGTSFLRMQKPEAYGENIFELRPIVRIANEEKSYKKGFEIGKHNHSYRYVFPVSFNGQHIGTVEFGLPFTLLLRSLVDSFKEEYLFHLDKQTLELKLDQLSLSGYTQCDIHQDLMISKDDLAVTELTGHPGHLDLKIITELNRKSLSLLDNSEWKNKNNIFDKSYRGNNYIISILPVYNIVGDVNGVLFSYFADSTLAAFRKNYLILYAIVTLFSIFFIILNYRSIRRSKEQSDFLHLALDSLPHPFYIVNVADYSLSLANTATADNNSWKGKTCHNITHQRDTPCSGIDHPCPLLGIKETGKPVIVEHIHFNKEGEERIVEVHGYPIIGRTGKLDQFIEYSVDITERKLAEKALAELNRDLEQKVKQRTSSLKESNRELESFSYTVSHDLRAPLRSLAGFAHLLQKKSAGSLDEKSSHYVKVIYDSAAQMGHLIDDLLSFSRMSRSDMMEVEVDLNNIIQAILSMYENETTERKIDWQIQSLPKVRGDTALLKQVFANLIDNAVKYSSKEEKPVIEIGFETDESDNYIFHVKDNGVGFDMQYKDKLFNVFQRLHRNEEFEGTGIGLASIRKIITRHSGECWAEGKLNEGSTFFFTLNKIKETMYEN